MQAKPIRLCVTCGKRHDTGVENKLTGEFNRIDECIDCLMSKCTFKFESRQITLDDLELKTPDEMQTELGEMMLKILSQYGPSYAPNPAIPIGNLECEYGTTGNIGFANAKMYNGEGKEMDVKCKCGKTAESVIIGKESYLGLCNDCQYGASE